MLAAPTRPQRATVCVQWTPSGRWEVTLPGSRRLLCDSLEDARRAGHRCAAEHGGSCTVVVRDAYHRVVSLETLH